MIVEPKPKTVPKRSNPAIAWARGVAGAVVGGLVGFLLFKLLLNNGLYAGILPGALVGVGYSIAARRRELVPGIICGIAGLIFGFWCDAATNNPPEDLISYFQTFNLVPMANKVMITIGGLAAFWFGRGR